MLLSLNWLREFVPFTGTDEELADRLTMLGLEVEEVIRPFAHLDNVVVGHVVECERHPEADKLSVCKVDVGEGEALPIVCGAPNVAKGQKVPVAKVGAELPGGMTIKKAKLRGQVSMGMICAEDEIGLGDSHAGIMVLDEALAVGTPLVDALGLDHTVLDVSITPNRGDCLSVLGIAREVAMAFGLPLTMPEARVAEVAEPAAELVRIVIDDPALCPLYQARILRGVKIGPSPAWMRYRLIAVGLRPISNIVDVTNYILMELGQPLHAFDRTLLEGGEIRVAAAEEGAKFTTLDGQERTLLGTDLLIRDAVKPVALAGVMGGANTEMNDASTEVLLECAVFNPPTIRKTARRLGLHSEASYRFERGVDQGGSPFAMERAASLMAALAGGEVLSGVVKAEPRPWENLTLRFRMGRCTSLLGIDLGVEFCRTTLEGLGCVVDATDPEDWKVVAPSHRLDLEREVDLFEEVARVYGMDRIEAVLPRVPKSLDAIALVDRRFDFSMRIKHWARGIGLRESINYSFVGHEDLDFFNLPKENRVSVMNPLSEEQNVLRTALAPSMLQNVRTNVGQGANRLRLFEFSKVFWADAQSETTVTEPSRIALLVYGRRDPERWPWPKEESAGYADVKGMVEHLLMSLELPGAEYRLRDGHPYLAPCVEVVLDDEVVGEIGRVKAEIADHYNARREVWIAEMDADALREWHEGLVPGFSPLAKFPAIKRDITFVAPATLSAGKLLAAIREVDEPLMEQVALVDCYEPEGGETRNLTVRLTYRHPERTLKDKDVEKRHAHIVKMVLDALPVRV
ncbi:phenylalanyl-tRNA synthetase beta chain [Desulfobaculum xiamenense]|uniref:Phenylalanine--tRNA ligase beta subunit n=1 Tax=Desulfobaculum xiamenense TaxID=995050 RepID=A0A846QRJ2_9BACT|nr:phenylalanine--tRNA ligase subunit beta [Desulfobaculum xiamenense]NJB69132.1 phenylalanyl-tRNA synthetase beta chain [Desulfobaculum xiamenense]